MPGRSASDGSELTWQVLGASRGEGGILGEGVRQALLRDSTYSACPGRGEGLLPVSIELEVLEDPARACAAMLLGPLLG